MTMLRFLYFSLLPAVALGIHSIAIYADVFKDTSFFKWTYPWIIDNVGGHITVDYHLLGSGRYSVYQMCALDQMKGNTFLQAQYLKCEAEGISSKICLCDNGVNPQIFRQCVLEEGNRAGAAALRYAQLNLHVSPVIELWPGNEIYGLSDSEYVNKICTLFSDEERPLACNRSFDGHNITMFVDKKAVVHFDCRGVY